MPKIKTNSGAAKRFRKTAGGYKHKQSYHSHILTKKSPKRKRQMRPKKELEAGDVKLVRRLLPND